MGGQGTQTAFGCQYKDAIDLGRTSGRLPAPLTIGSNDSDVVWGN